MEKLTDLDEKRQKLLDKIRQLESDLKKTLNKDPDENALEEEGREVLDGVYRIEKENLKKLDAEINSIKLGMK